MKNLEMNARQVEAIGLRMRCLELAVETAPPACELDEILEVADLFTEWATKPFPERNP